MLETVVKDDQLGIQLGDGDLGKPDPIGVLEMGYVGEVFLQHQTLVVDSAPVWP